MFFVTACDKKHKGLSNTQLIGTWKEKETGFSFAGETYTVTFMEDGHFKASIWFYTDMINPSNPCFKNPTSWVKGTFTAAGNKISFTGNYMDSNFIHIQPNCLGKTEYSASFISQLNGDELILNADAQNEWEKIKTYRVK